MKKPGECLKWDTAKSLNALNTVGYKEIIAALEGETDMDTAIELIKRNTRRFAKRQMTWFRRDQRINWFPLNSEEELFALPEKILEIINIAHC